VLNFSGLSRHRFVGWLLRVPLQLIPRTAVVPIVQGRLRGLRWVVGAGNHGCWLGSYEVAMQRRFASEVVAGQVVYDVGANVGFYSLLAARCVGATGRVFAFEPLPENLEYLKRHVTLNALDQIAIEPVAVCEVTTTLQFTRGNNSCTGRLDTVGDLKVKALALDDFVFDEGHPPPDLVKIDVEGAEVRVLQGARRLLEGRRPLLFLATHGAARYQECCTLLRDAGYRWEGIDGEAGAGATELLCRPLKVSPR
jgi:FkbM family methyltransferase